MTRWSNMVIPHKIQTSELPHVGNSDGNQDVEANVQVQDGNQFQNVTLFHYHLKGLSYFYIKMSAIFFKDSITHKTIIKYNSVVLKQW